MIMANSETVLQAVDAYRQTLKTRYLNKQKQRVDLKAQYDKLGDEMAALKETYDALDAEIALPTPAEPGGV